MYVKITEKVKNYKVGDVVEVDNIEGNYLLGNNLSQKRYAVETTKPAEKPEKKDKKNGK